MNRNFVCVEGAGIPLPKLHIIAWSRGRQSLAVIVLVSAAD